MRRPTRPRMWQVLREQEGARVYSELQSKHRAAYGDDEAAREAAGKAALLRAKESLSTGWAARLCCEQRGRLAAARLPQLRGVRQRVQAVESARECAPERATRERSRFQSASVCVCGHSRARGACSRPRTNATVSACSRLRTNAEIAGVNARVPWTNAILGGENEGRLLRTPAVCGFTNGITVIYGPVEGPARACDVGRLEGGAVKSVYFGSLSCFFAQAWLQRCGVQQVSQLE